MERRKGSTTTRLLVTKTVDGATASNTLIELRSSSVFAPGLRGTMAGGTGAGTGAGAGAAGGGTSGAGAGGAAGAGSGRLALGLGSASGACSAPRSWQVLRAQMPNT